MLFASSIEEHGCFMVLNGDDARLFKVRWDSSEKLTAVGFESLLASHSAEGHCALCCSVESSSGTS